MSLSTWVAPDQQISQIPDEPRQGQKLHELSISIKRYFFTDHDKGKGNNGTEERNTKAAIKLHSEKLLDRGEQENADKALNEAIERFTRTETKDWHFAWYESGNGIGNS